MLTEFWTWWLQRMTELVPERLIRQQAGDSHALLVGVEEEFAQPQIVSFALRRQRAEIALGRFALDEAGLRAARAALDAHRRPGAVILGLPAGAVLERDVVLPLAAERETANVLRYEMDRLTPFAAEDVFWTWAVERRDRVRGTLHLRLAFVPKAGLRLVLAALAGLGTPATDIQQRPAATGAAGPRIPLILPLSRGRRWQRRVLYAGAWGCAALACAAIVTPFVRQAMDRAAVESRIEAMAPRVRVAETLRQRVTHADAGRDVLAAEQARFGDPLQALATVTQLLPDDTYLTELTLNERKMSFAGRSAGAARLIAVLSANPTVRNPVFSAPVTRAEDGNSDLFSIRADLAP